MIRLAVVLIYLALPVQAETVLASRTIPAKTIIGPGDIVMNPAHVTGAITDPDLVIGQEARVALYAGRPIRAADIGEPAIVERNQIIILHYTANGLAISTEGRALDRAGPDEVIRVMNLGSRTTVTARIARDGTAHVQP